MYICSSVFMGFEMFFMRDKWAPISYSISELQSPDSQDNANYWNMPVSADSRAWKKREEKEWKLISVAAFHV